MKKYLMYSFTSAYPHMPAYTPSAPSIYIYIYIHILVYSFQQYECANGFPLFSSFLRSNNLGISGILILRLSFMTKIIMLNFFSLCWTSNLTRHKRTTNSVAVGGFPRTKSEKDELHLNDKQHNEWTKEIMSSAYALLCASYIFINNTWLVFGIR